MVVDRWDQVDANLTGVNLSIESFTSWLRGGVSFATPDPPGEKVFTGYRFGLAEKADPDWLSWEPHIAAGPWSVQGNNQQTAATRRAHCCELAINFFGIQPPQERSSLVPAHGR